MTNSLDRAKHLLRSARRIVIFTGAGVSAESGIPTFRDDSGLWREFPPERYAHWKGLLQEAWRNPEGVCRFLLGVIKPIAQATPNAAHQAIARLEQERSATVITQNIDGLHQEAGNIRVREIHGSLFKIVDGEDQIVRKLSRPDLQRLVIDLEQMLQTKVSVLKLLSSFKSLIGVSFRGLIRPKIVLFNDAMAEPDWQQAQNDAEECDLMLVVGTSAQVYPAALLPHQAKRRGARIIEINPSADSATSDIHLPGKAAEILPLLLD